MRISDWSSDVCSSDLRSATLACLMLQSMADHYFHSVPKPVDGQNKPEQFRLALGEANRSEEHTSELQSLMRISYAVFCLTKKTPRTPAKYPSSFFICTISSISSFHNLSCNNT